MEKSVSNYINRLHERLLALRDGSVADYIPELTRVDPDWFGIALVTVEGHVHRAGDWLQTFTIQSISKPFTYGIALEDNGIDEVRRRIDVEPSGEAFNSISLEPDTGRPRNPMINAGAIVSADLVDGNTGTDKFERIVQTFGRYAARDLHMDEQVYVSEKTTGHRNRAISHLLRNYEILGGDPEEPLDAYFRQCSILVNAQDLAVMGATLANKGVNPITNIRAVKAEQVPAVLAVMSSCGMYDYSGNWIATVGLPAKSGVGGGIVAVLPGQFGLAVFSPRLDAKGNSVRGIRVCEALSRDFGLHMLDSARMTASNTVRAVYTIAEVSSRFERRPEEAALISETGDQVLVCELTGEQSLVTSEALSTDLLGRMTDRDWLVLDFKRMTGVDVASSKLFDDLVRQLTGAGKRVLVSGVRDKFSFRKRLLKALPAAGEGERPEFDELDQAIQFCEERLLADRFDTTSEQRTVPLTEQALSRGLDRGQVAWLESLLTRKSFRSGEVICAAGEPSDTVYVIERGKVDVMLRGEGREACKVVSYCGGAVFGETAFFEASVRSADVVAASEVAVFALRPADLESSGDARAMAVLLQFYRNLAEIGFARLRNVNRVLLTLTG